MASVAHMVDAALAGYTKSADATDLNLPSTDTLNLVLNQTSWRGFMQSQWLQGYALHDDDHHHSQIHSNKVSIPIT